MQSPTTPLCPVCDGPMVKRKSAHGEFFGCAKFPACRGTRDASGRGRKTVAPVQETIYQPIPIMPGSEEQEAIWAHMLNEDSHLIVNSGPGVGKTHTAVQFCLRAPRRLRILFVAYNRHIAKEANGKLKASGCTNTQARTTHSLGLGMLRDAYPTLGEPNDEKMTGILEVLSPEPLLNKGEWRRTLNMAEKLCGYTKNYMLDFRAETFQEELEAICDHHKVEMNGVFLKALPLVVPALEECIRQAPVSVDFDDMIWLPVMLDLPMLSPAAVTIIDELQDCNKAQHHLALKAAGNGRIMGIGDHFQCQPPDTVISLAGGVATTLQNIKVGDEVVGFNSKMTYFPGRKVLQVAQRDYKGPLIHVAAGTYKSRYTPEHRCLVRLSNIGQYAVYAMQKGEDVRVGACQLMYANGSGVSMRARQENADAAWILSVEPNKEMALIQEARIAAKFGLCQTILKENQDNKGQGHSQDFIDHIYTWLEQHDQMTDKLKTCLEWFGRRYEFPFWSREHHNQHVGRYSFITQACNLIEGAMQVKVFDGDIRNSKWESIKEVKQLHYEGPVISLKVQPTDDGRRLYVGDGIVTHNSIYAFRGSATESMADFTRILSETERGVTELGLTVTRRCPKSHVRLAQALSPNIRALDDAPEGIIMSMSEAQATDMLAPDDMVICRINAALVKVAYALIRRGLRPVIKGRDIGKELTTFARKLKDGYGVWPAHGGEQMRCLRDALRVYAAEEASKLSALGDKAKGRIEALNDRCACLLEFITNSNSFDSMIDKIQAIFQDFEGKPANSVILGTVHRTKGLEAERVFVLKPNLIPHPLADTEWEREQETHIAWIAATRAKFNAKTGAPGTLVFCGAVPDIYNYKPAPAEEEELAEYEQDLNLEELL